jgi:hypothetical protein
MGPLGRLLGFAAICLVAVLVPPGGIVLFAPLYWAFAVRDRDKRAAAAFAKLQSTLMPHETVAEKALQLRLCALTTRRLLVAITNSRMIIVERPLLGGFAMKDYQWKDLVDVQLSENVLPQYFGSKIRFKAKDQTAAQKSVEVDGIDSTAASRIYAHAQGQEQAWEEKNRVRGLEEKRAAAGGVIIGGMAASNNNGALEELERAKKLFDGGGISDAEYHELKAKILSRAG